MLTIEQISIIEAELLAGDTPEMIAERRGISRQALQNRLLNSGKRITTYRRLEDTAPVDAKATIVPEFAVA